MKARYFVLKPKGDDPYARASRLAMRQYARSIFKINPILSNELITWTNDEEKKAIAMRKDK